MIWKDKINEWNNGKILEYPKDIKSRFFFEKFVCDKDLNNQYQEIFIENNSLNKLTVDFSHFK